MNSAGRLLWPYVKRHAWALAGAGGGTIVLTAATLASPWPLKFVIDGLFANRARPFDLSGGDLWLLSGVAALMLIIAGVKAGAEYYADVWLKRPGEQITHELRVTLYEHLQRLSLAYHDTQKKGNLVTRVTGDVNSVGQLFSESLGEIMAAALLLLGMAAVTVVMDPLLALAMLAVVPFLFFVTSHYKRRLKLLARRQRAEEGEIASLANEALSSMQVVKAFGSEAFEHRRVALRSETRLQIGVELSRTEARFSGLVDVLGAIAAALVTVIGVFRVAAGSLTPGDLIVFTSYASKTYKPLRDIARQLGKVSQAMARTDRVAEILSSDARLEDRPRGYRGGRAAGDVELHRASFAYTDGRPVVKDVSLKIPAGSRVAIVGPSGAGKSTLGALIARFYDPTAGGVLIDGMDARACSLPWLREQVGFLLQDTVLFSGSVADNIAYASEASPGEVVSAAKTSHAHGFISDLPAGYDTELGPRGVGLSGGQRQRIGIARVLLRDPPILILDEPTVGLDTKSEAQVIEGLYGLMRGRTTIIITHSIELARTADRVIVFDAGRVVEDGTPEELLAGKGAFTRLARGASKAAEWRMPSTPRDPALPQLDRLLDVEEMEPILRRSLKGDLRETRIRNLCIERVRYKPRERVMVHYGATIAGAQHDAVATVYADQDMAAKVRKPHYMRMAEVVNGRSPAVQPVFHDDEIDAVVSWLPFDVKLPGVAVPGPELAHRLLGAGVAAPESADDPAVVNYKPGSRGVMRFGDHFLKAYGKSADFDSALAGLAATDRAGSLPTARFEAAFPDLRLTVQAAVEGSTPPSAEDLASWAGGFLRLLQGQPFEDLTVAAPEVQVAEAGRHAALAGALVPDLGPRLEGLMTRLTTAIPSGLALYPAHGDFSPDQLLVHEQGVVVVDFDGLCRAPAALDIAAYVAEVAVGDGRDAGRIRAVLDGLLSGYGDPPEDLSWYLCAALLSRVTQPFRHQADAWVERMHGLVEAAEEARTL